MFTPIIRRKVTLSSTRTSVNRSLSAKLTGFVTLDQSDSCGNREQMIKLPSDMQTQLNETAIMDMRPLSIFEAQGMLKFAQDLVNTAARLGRFDAKSTTVASKNLSRTTSESPMTGLAQKFRKKWLKLIQRRTLPTRGQTDLQERRTRHCPVFTQPKTLSAEIGLENREI